MSRKSGLNNVKPFLKMKKLRLRKMKCLRYRSGRARDKFSVLGLLPPDSALHDVSCLHRSASVLVMSHYHKSSQDFSVLYAFNLKKPFCD
jgi:hypothetical protein